MGFYVLLALLGIALWMLAGCAAQPPLGGRYEFNPTPAHVKAFSKGAAEGAAAGMTGGGAPAATLIIERIKTKL